MFGTGQVGIALAAHLAGLGIAVRAVSRHRPPALAGVDWRAADAADSEAAADVAKGASVIYQCLNAPYTQWPERFPPLQRGVLAAAERTGALLVSLENLYGYGPAGGSPMTEDLPLAATTVKGRARAAMTAELLAAAAAGRVRIAIGRASDFFGPGVTQGSTLGERVFGNALAGRRADFIGNPGLPHTYSYVPGIAAGRPPWAPTPARPARCGICPARRPSPPGHCWTWLPAARPPARRGPAQHQGPMIMPQADAPETGFRPFFNPATGEWITYTATAEDNHGQLVRFTWRSVPGGVLTEHIHPHQEERFTILAGQARFTLAGEELVAGAGETIVVPAGVPHSEGNPGPAEIEGVVELRPALHTKEWHEALAAGRRRQDHAQRRAAQPAPARRHLLVLPPRKPDHLTTHLGPEPHAPAPVGAGQGLPRPPLLRPLGQPDPGNWLKPPRISFHTTGGGDPSDAPRPR